MAEALGFWATWSWLLFLLALALLVAVGALWWRDRRALGAADTEHAQAAARLRNELGELRTQHAQQDEKHWTEMAATRSALVLRTARSVARAVAVLSRDALAAGNHDAVQTAFDDLVQESGLTSLTFFDAAGVARVATDRKVLGSAAEDQADRDALANAEVVVGQRAVYVPVMSFTDRLGTLRVGYDAGA